MTNFDLPHIDPQLREIAMHIRSIAKREFGMHFTQADCLDVIRQVEWLHQQGAGRYTSDIVRLGIKKKILRDALLK